jgi:hypothetical protein
MNTLFMAVCLFWDEMNFRDETYVDVKKSGCTVVSQGDETYGDVITGTCHTTAPPH